MTRIASAIAAALLAALALVGPVRAQEQTTPPPGPEVPTEISADNMSGSHGPEGDIILLRGNVRIVRGRTVITAESGTYDRAQAMIYLDNRVKIVDSTTTITCDRASYNERTDVVQLSGNVVAVDRDATLRAPAATFDRLSGRADMTGGVVATQRKQRILSDRAIYDRDSLIIHAIGNVRGYDDENHLLLAGHQVVYDRGTNEAEARGEPSLTSTDVDGVKTVITARVLRMNTETRVAEAIDSVFVVRDTVKASGQYGIFDDRANRGWLVGSPKAWDNQTTVTGDTLEMRTRQRVLERVVVVGNAAMEYKGMRPGVVGETSRLTGQRVDVFFTNQDIDSLVAIGNARNDYLATPLAGKTAESNVALGDTITVFFKQRKIDRARVQGKASGEYHLPVAVADTGAARNEVISYDAEAIHYLVPKNQIVLDHSAHLTYRDLELRARRVEFNSEKQTLVAEGSPELVDRGDKVTGHLMTYDLESRVGNIYQAATSYEKGLYHGERIVKASDKELDVKGGRYSTCDLEDPHYHFAARWMKIYLKDKLIAKPVVFYVRNVPLLALPFGIFPIKAGRHSGFLFPQMEFGFNSAAGRFIRNAGYYWAPNDYFDFTGSGDYYEAQPSWVIRGEGVYKLMYKFDGDFRTSYARNDFDKTEDWDLYANHAQDVSKRTRLTARAEFVSSRDYNSSNLYGRPLSQRLNRFLTSNLSVSHNADWASFSGFLDRRQDLDADQSVVDPDGEGPEHGPPVGTSASLPNLTESLPSLTLAFPTRTIGSLPWLRGSSFEKSLSTVYLSFGARFLSTHERRAKVIGTQSFLREEFVDDIPDTVVDSSNVITQVDTRRYGSQGAFSLSDARRLFGWINVRPSINADVAVFDHDELGNKNVPTGTWSAAVSSGTAFYGTFRPRLGPLTGLRHIVIPNASYTYSPEFPHLFYIDPVTGQKLPRFSNFGGIGVSGAEQQRLDLSLDQRLQVRLGSGEKVRKLDNLLALALGTSYNFLYREQNLVHPLAPISGSLLLQPPGILNGTAQFTVDSYSQRPLRAFTYNVGLDLQGGKRLNAAAPELPLEERSPLESYDSDAFQDFEGTWSLGMTYSYAGGYSGPEWATAKTANGVLRYQFTPNWSMSYSTSYDVSNRQFGTQYFELQRTLHCWVASFSRQFAPGGEAEYYFKIAAKDQHELFLEQGTRAVSIGGIH